MRSLITGCAVSLLATAFLPAPTVMASGRFTPVLHVTPAPDIYAGDTVRVWITAQAWPAPMTARVWFQSASESWQSAAGWNPDCVCFSVQRQLLPLNHPDESAKVVVRLAWGKYSAHQWWLTNRDSAASADLRALVVHGTRLIPLPPTPTVPELGGGGTSDYRVKPGDTLWAIAKAHRISLNQLEAANPQIPNPNVLYVGEIVHLHSP